MINGYSSRLHYMTDWFYDNEKNGVLKMDFKWRLFLKIILKKIN